MQSIDPLGHQALAAIQAAILDSLSDVVVAHTIEGRALYANEAFLRQIGLAAPDLPALEPYGWLSPEQRRRQNWIMERLARRGEAEYEMLFETDSGVRHVTVNARIVRFGEAAVVLSIAKDETEKHRAISDLEFRSLLLDSANDAVVVHDLEGRILLVNETCCEQRGYSESELCSMKMPELVSPARRPFFERNLASGLRDGRTVFESEHLCKDGSVMPVEVRARVVEFGGRNVVVGVVRDITDRKQVERNVEQLAYYDPLTDLPNRRLFMDRLERATAHLKRSHEKLAVLFVDVGDLKNVNDSLGRAASDNVLLAVAERLSGLVRYDDTVARLGDDEFTILLMGADEVRAEEVARRVAGALAKPFDVNGKRTYVAASIGVAVASEDTQRPDEVLRNADLAMYSVKTGQRDGYRLYEPSLGAAARERFDLTNDLRDALERGELSIHYQPQVRVSDKKIVGAEALVRWNHPSRGTISPVEFIPIGEETGLIVPLGEWVLRESCAAHAAWREAGCPLRVAVNVSPRQLLQTDFVSVVTDVLAAHEMEPGFLELEMTENIAQNRSPQLRETLHQLSDLGVRIAIDDFGTGYSSLSQLQSLPIQTLKIDRSFILAINHAPSVQIARAVLSLAHGLNLNVVAEGVETPEQLEFLQQHDCAEYQGFLFSRPLPHDALLELISAERELRD